MSLAQISRAAKLALVRRIYLDQNMWIGLTNARVGRANGARFLDLLAECRRSAAAGSAHFVLSMANYEEDWRRGSVDDRVQVAMTMAELTEFENIAPVWRIIEWEISDALHVCLELPGPRPVYNVFGQGANDLLNTPVLTVDLFSPELQDKLRASPSIGDHVLDLLEQAALCGPPGDHATFGMDRPDRDHQRAYVATRETVAERLRSMGPTPDLAERYVKALDLVDMMPIIEARANLVGRVVRDLTDLGLDGVERFLAALPMGSIVTALHTSAIRDNRKWKINDYNDVLYLSAAAAYCDVVAGEKHWTTKLSQPKVPTRATIVNTPQHLCEVLAATR